MGQRNETVWRERGEEKVTSLAEILTLAKNWSSGGRAGTEMLNRSARYVPALRGHVHGVPVASKNRHSISSDSRFWQKSCFNLYRVKQEDWKVFVSVRAKWAKVTWQDLWQVLFPCPAALFPCFRLCKQRGTRCQEMFSQSKKQSYSSHYHVTGAEVVVEAGNFGVTSEGKWADRCDGPHSGFNVLQDLYFSSDVDRVSPSQREWIHSHLLEADDRFLVSCFVVGNGWQSVIHRITACRLSWHTRCCLSQHFGWGYRSNMLSQIQ